MHTNKERGSENLELELRKQFKASQERYVYFLLAAAASAIGFEMIQSKVEPLAWIQLPLGLSVLLWAVSFFAGLRFVEYATNVTFQNQNYMAFKRELRSFIFGGNKLPQNVIFLERK